MIDFIKCEVLGANIPNLKMIKALDFCGRYHLTGVLDERRIYANHKQMKITIHEDRRVFLEGSLPMMVLGNNFENLKFEEFKHGINELEALFGVPSDNFLLQNFEFGFSINLGNKSPTDFLIDDLIDFKGELRSEDTYKKNGYGISFIKSQFHLKLYDKSSQYDLASNVLRIEIRVKKMDYVKRRYKIDTLKDLLSTTLWFQLKKHLAKVISELIVCSFDNIDFSTIPQQDLRDIITWKNPEFWRINRPKSKTYSSGFNDGFYQKMRKMYYEKKDKFGQLIAKYELAKSKEYILGQVNKEYRIVVPTPPLIEEYERNYLLRKTRYTPQDFMFRR